MTGNRALGKDKDAKQDGLYTQLSDIEDELGHYRPHFKGKTVLCNCDDPYDSNFFKCFALNFNGLKLKKSIATRHPGQPIAWTQPHLFGEETKGERRALHKAIVTTVHDTTGEGRVCPLCGEHFEFEETQADHIEPWGKSGRTVPENCQMLRRSYNLKKGSR